MFELNGNSNGKSKWQATMIIIKVAVMSATMKMIQSEEWM